MMKLTLVIVLNIKASSYEGILAYLLRKLKYLQNTL